MQLTPIRHEDDRRILTEYISDIPFKRAKVIEAKGKVTVGNHYHEKNDSVFYILKGKARMSLYPYYQKKHEARPTVRWLFQGDCELVRMGTVHIFEMYPDTIMLETATEPYDKTDEIQAPE